MRIVLMIIAIAAGVFLFAPRWRKRAQRGMALRAKELLDATLDRVEELSEPAA